MWYWTRCFLSVGFLVVMLLPILLGAQGWRPEVAAGVAIPRGALSEQHGVGPLLRAGVLFGRVERRVQFRVDGEVSWLPRNASATAALSEPGDWRTVGAVGSAIMRFRRRGLTPYAVLGVAVQHVTVKHRSNPYGAVPGLRVGGGMQGRWKRSVIRLEVTPHVVLSDHGIGREYGVGRYWPLAVGLTF